MGCRDRIKLSERLMNSCEMVTPGLKVADVGCDHAHTSIWLIKNGIVPGAIAMDVRPGPLEKAAENIRLYGVEDRIELRLSNGLEALKENEAGSVIIAGMGGMLTVQILKEGLNKAVACKELILQPQSDIGMVRRFLFANGFCIVREKMCREYGKYYTSMKAVPAGSDGDVSDNELFEEFGEILLRSKDPVLRDLLGELKRKNERNLLRIQNGASAEAREKTLELLHEKKLIENALSFYNPESNGRENL